MLSEEEKPLKDNQYNQDNDRKVAPSHSIIEEAARVGHTIHTTTSYILHEDDVHRMLKDELKKLKETFQAQHEDFKTQQDEIVRAQQETIKALQDDHRTLTEEVTNLKARNTYEMMFRNNSDDSNRDDAKDFLFKGSTNRYLFVETIKLSDGKEYKIRWKHTALALFVIFVQLNAYFLILLFVINENHIVENGLDNPSIEILGKDYCDGFNDASLAEGANFTTLRELLFSIRCSDPEEIYGMLEDGDSKRFRYYSGWLEFIILLSFLIPDFFDAFILFMCPGWKAKIVAFVFFIMAFVPWFLFSIFVNMVGMLGYLDTFFLIVGIVFVHDIDDQVGKMMDTFHSVKRPWLEIQFWTFMFTAILIVTLLQARKFYPEIDDFQPILLN